MTSHFASLAGLGIVLIFLAATAHTIYNLFFHPLASFPGPLLHRASRWTFLYKLYRGTLVFDVLALHEKYGPVVRIAPDELAFADAQGWKDIYGHRTGAALGTDEMPKWYRFFNIPGIQPSIISETRNNHTALRRQMAHGFSDKSMREQEPIIGSYVNRLIQRLRERTIDPDRRHPVTGGPCQRRLDMTCWYNWTTFDIISDLAFGEPLGCLDLCEQHPWLVAVQGTLKTNVVRLTLSHMGLSSLMPLLVKYGLKRRKDHFARTAEKLQRRVEMTTERPDFMEGLLKKKEEWNMSMEKLQSNAGALIVAGSETTATLLCGVTYLLLRNPEAMVKVAEEVRSTFRSDEEITLTSVSGLTYMLACLNEGLRSYPPVPCGLPRMVPRGGATISGMAVPENTGVSVWQWATYHRSDSWTEPFEFRPERFLGDPKFTGDKVDTLQPFSVGPRNCIGRNLAYAEMRLILAKVLFNFDMELADKEVDWWAQKAYLLWDKPPLEVYLTPRN